MTHGPVEDTYAVRAELRRISDTACGGRGCSSTAAGWGWRRCVGASSPTTRVSAATDRRMCSRTLLGCFAPPFAWFGCVHMGPKHPISGFLSRVNVILIVCASRYVIHSRRAAVVTSCGHYTRGCQVQVQSPFSGCRISDSLNRILANSNLTWMRS